MQDLKKSQIEPVPKDWKTVEAWAREMELSESRVRSMLKQLMGADKVERKKFVIFLDGQLRAVPHYRVMASRPRRAAAYGSQP